MNDASRSVHVVFGQSTAETLREALPLLGVSGDVVGLPDGLSVGPIDPPDPAVRQQWGKSVLRADPSLRDGLIDDPAHVEATWAAATAPGINAVFWVCMSSPFEHACFLAFAARMQDRPFDIVDATKLEFTTPDGVRSLGSLGSMRAKDIVASGLYAMRRTITPGECRAASDAWSRLRRENAPFRIVRDGRLMSAPLTQYDAFLIEQASPDWEVAARLIGRAITNLTHTRGGESTSAVVLFGRLLALAEGKLLDMTGPGPGMRDYTIRSPERGTHALPTR